MTAPELRVARWTALLSVAFAGCGSEPISPCAGITCSGFGTCVVEANQAACRCNDGYRADGLLCAATSGTVTTNQIVQYGIAWTFDRQVEYGRYANGDFWVLGPMTVTRIDPGFDGAHHGWEVNPTDTTLQGFDARIADFDRTRVPSLPYAASSGQSLVKGSSKAPLNAECRPCLQTAAVLTVVGEVPPDRGATVFRPPYFGAEKPSVSTAGLRPELLPSLSPPAEPPTLAEAADGIRRVQLDQKQGWTGRPLHPEDNMPDYGSGIADRTAEIALRLMLDDPPADKLELLVLYVQAGLDWYRMALGGLEWGAGGTHGMGRKLVIAFAGVLLGDAEMQSFVREAGPTLFAEDGSIYEATNAGRVLYGDGDGAEEPYWRNLVFDTGSRTRLDPYGWIDGGHIPGDSYQFCCLSMPWKATTTALRLMPALRTVWNHEQLFQYVDRWVTQGAWTQPDPCAPPDGRCSGGSRAGTPCTTASAPTACTGTDAYCDTTVNWNAHYGVTYGPDGHGGCIPDNDPSDGIGRFPLLHGSNADSGYWGSSFAEAMWDTHVAQ